MFNYDPTNLMPLSRTVKVDNERELWHTLAKNLQQEIPNNHAGIEIGAEISQRDFDQGQWSAQTHIKLECQRFLNTLRESEEFQKFSFGCRFEKDPNLLAFVIYVTMKLKDKYRQS